MSESTTPAIDRGIYPMPMFATFLVADVEASATFYQHVGFVRLATVAAPDGTPAVIHLRRCRYQDLLLVPGTATTGSVTVSFAAAGQDLTNLAASLRTLDLRAPATIAGPTDTLWFTTDLTIDDPDGNRIILTAPRTTESPEAQRWVEQNITGDFVVEAPGQDQ